MNTAVYDAGLRGARTELVHSTGHRRELPVARWSGDIDDADNALLSRCLGPTVDVGCGPGRLTAALLARGIPALGVDVSAEAVAMTRRRGGIALQRNIFGTIPGSGRWAHLLLADGNIGIGGDPVRLLRRCGRLLAAGGDVLLDLEPPGTGLLVEQIRLAGAGAMSEPFRWCWVGVDAIPEIAAAAGLVVVDLWLAGDRWQARLVKSHG